MRVAEELETRPDGSNPVSGLRRYRRPKKDRALSPEELARLGATLDSKKKKHPHLVAFFTLLLLTGCRKSELLNLEWRDYRDGHLHLRDSKTRPKTVFLSSQARAVLGGLRTKSGRRVFPPPKRGRNGMSNHRFWQNLIREADLKGLRIHDLRHTFASYAVRIGVSLIVTGLLLGHRNPQSTLRYAHMDDATMRNAVELVDNGLANRNEGVAS